MLPLLIENKEQDIKKIVESAGAELVEISFRRAGRRGILTTIVDKKGGITLDECADINRRLGAYFDELSEKGVESEGFEADMLQGPYYLEVNSPGLDRPIKTGRDFERALGETVNVISREDTGFTVVRTGEVLSVKDGLVEMRMAEDGSLALLPIASVIKAVREIKF